MIHTPVVLVTRAQRPYSSLTFGSGRSSVLEATLLFPVVSKPSAAGVFVLGWVFLWSSIVTFSTDNNPSEHRTGYELKTMAQKLLVNANATSPAAPVLFTPRETMRTQSPIHAVISKGTYRLAVLCCCLFHVAKFIRKGVFLIICSGACTTSSQPRVALRARVQPSCLLQGTM